jgi:hypothetical protein
VVTNHCGMLSDSIHWENEHPVPGRRSRGHADLGRIGSKGGCNEKRGQPVTANPPSPDVS